MQVSHQAGIYGTVVAVEQETGVAVMHPEEKGAEEIRFSTEGVTLGVGDKVRIDPTGVSGVLVTSRRTRPLLGQ